MKRTVGLLSAVVVTGAVMCGGISLAAVPFSPFFQEQQSLKGQRQDATARVVVNQDQLEGLWKQFKGELKEKWAQFTEDDLLTIEGRVDKLEGKIQERYGDRREEVKEWVDQWFDRHSRPEGSQS